MASEHADRGKDRASKTRRDASTPAPANVEPSQGDAQSKPQPDEIAFDRPKTSKLVTKGGKVDRSAIFYAAQAEAEAEARALREAQSNPKAVITDEDLLDASLPPSSLEALSDEDPEAEDGDAPLPPNAHTPAGSPGASAAAAQKVTFKLKRDLDKRLDKYLVDRITFMSRAKLQALIDDGGVKVNGRLGKASTKLRQNDLVEVMIPPPPAPDAVPEDIPLEVMFEDEHLIVINKSPDIIVHPARSHNRGTMINALAFHFRARSPLGGSLSDVGKEFARPGVVHRLDRQTSGVIVFAKSEQAHWKIAQQFENRTTDKRYVAFVHGHLDRDAEQIDLPLGPSPSREKGHREKQVVRHDHLGKPALTVYRVLGRYAVPSESAMDRARKDALGPDLDPDARFMGVSVVEIELKTGRTHQIRVHMASLGHPLLADDLYGGALLPARESLNWPGLNRVGLHAAMLSFRHPITNQPLRFVAPLPTDLRQALHAMRAGPVKREPEQPLVGTILSLDSLLAPG